MSHSAACSRLGCIKDRVWSLASYGCSPVRKASVWEATVLVFENLVSLLVVKVALGRSLLTVWPKVEGCFRVRGYNKVRSITSEFETARRARVRSEVDKREPRGNVYQMKMNRMNRNATQANQPTGCIVLGVSQVALCT